MFTPAFAADAAQQSPSLIAQFAPLLVIFAIFYFLLIRPQQKRQKEHRQKLDSIGKGDVVVTAGGIKATVLKVDGAELEVEISKGVTVTVMRSTVLDLVGGKVNPAPAKETAKKAPAKKKAAAKKS